MQDQSSTAITCCPSFSSYSSVKIAEIAADAVAREEDETEDDEEEFEFVLVRASPGVDSASTLANENGSEAYFRPVFPLFNRDLVIDDDEEVERQMRIPLNKMFIGDDRDPASLESDEPEGLQERKFCLWTLSPSPLRSPAASPARCQKSSSQGASSSKRRWRLRDLLRRCSSDGRQASLVLLTPKSDNFKEDSKPEKTEKTKTKPLSPAKPAAKQKVSAHEVFYVRNKALKEGDKRKSYLPYRRDLVGFFSSFNGFSKNFVPF